MLVVLFEGDGVPEDGCEDLREGSTDEETLCEIVRCKALEDYFREFRDVEDFGRCCRWRCHSFFLVREGKEKGGGKRSSGGES